MTGTRLGVCGLTLLLVAGCDDGDGGSTPAPPNQPPTFSSTASATVVENNALQYTATAADPDGGAVTIAVAAGGDAARFTLSADGKLNFLTPPDFEAPTDAGANNVYDVQLVARDAGGATATLNLQITVTDQRDIAETRLIGSGFTNVVSAAMITDRYVVTTDTLYIAEPGAVILLATDGSGTKQTVLGTAGAATLPDGGVIIDMAAGYITPRPMIPGPSYWGFLMIRQPDGRLRVDIYSLGATSPSHGATWLRLRTIASATPPAGAVAQDVGGVLDIDSNGRLLISYTDAGFEDLAQDLASSWGKTACLIPANYYRPPIDAPASVFSCTISPSPWPGGWYATGLRRPSGAFTDRGIDWQELNLFPNSGNAGLNRGWPWRDGANERRPGGPAGMTDPALQYRTGTGPNEGGGIVLAGPYPGFYAPFRNHIIFGDSVTGSIWSVPLASLVAGQTVGSTGFVRRNAEMNFQGGTINRVADFAYDENGDLYILDGLDGQVFEMTAR